jgi:hypothetical protein
VRGALLRDREGWRFRPEEYISGAGEGGALGMARFVVGSRRRARAYLAARGLSRPRIPWDEIIAAKWQAGLGQQGQPAGGSKARVVLLVAVGVALVGVGALAFVVLRRDRVSA